MQNARPFNSSNPLLLDRADLTRIVEIGSEDGTPILESQVVIAGMPCRVDALAARRRDQVNREEITADHVNSGTIFAPPDADVEVNDVLVITTRGNQAWRINAINQALSFSGISHLELDVYLDETAI